MGLTSVDFLGFLLCTLVLYYILPRKFRWLAIFAANLFFLYKNNSIRENMVWLIEAALAYFAALIISRKREGGLARFAALLSVTALAAALLVLKEASFFHLPSFGISPAGISYYTLAWIAYILGVYWGTGDVQSNPLKFLGFAGFFSVLPSGPITAYDGFKESLTEGVKFEYKNVANGCIRIAWGFLKKLVVADRIGVFVNTAFGTPYMYPGFYRLVANIFFVIQLYMDFSGCTDIAIGAGELFGIKIPENFNLPFLSETLEEFWRRWHITLGGWLRDYVLYPLLKSGLWQGMGKITRKIFGKKYGKKIPTWIALMISWFLIGLWHGGSWNYIFGVGLLFGVIIISGDLFKPLLDGLNRLLHINTGAVSWKIFRVLRTWFFFMTGLSFFRAKSLMTAFDNLKLQYTVFNPWIFFDGSLYTLGLDRTEFAIFMFFFTVVAAAGIIRAATGRSIRELLWEQNMVFRWILLILMVYSIIIYGSYGRGFSSAAFIYQGF